MSSDFAVPLVATLHLGSGSRIALFNSIPIGFFLERTLESGNVSSDFDSRSGPFVRYLGALFHCASWALLLHSGGPAPPVWPPRP